MQEAHDLALVAQAASLATRIPFVHFFDGFRTSHELNTIDLLTDDDLRALIPEELIRAHRARALSPDRPFIRGTAQNPDVYFQARESVNPFYAQVPGAVTAAMDALAARTGRQYHLADYTGHPDADRVIVIMGSGAQTAAETAQYLAARGERVGVVTVRLFRPFPAAAVLAALPSSARRVAVLDRTKEPGSQGEPLFLDVLTALAEAHAAGTKEIMPVVTGGRYGLSSKEFTPGMVAGVFADLAAGQPKPRFTIGINDDVSGISLDYGELAIEPASTIGAVFFGLGSDGTVGANKNTIKILGADTGLNAQGYFVYDSKKSGSQTVSHLRFGPEPIRAPYLVSNARFVGCHQAELLDRVDVLGRAAPGATLLLNSPHPEADVWDSLPRPVQEQILAKGITLYTIDASQVARDAGLPGPDQRGPADLLLRHLRGAAAGTRRSPRSRRRSPRRYGRRGADVVERNHAAVDAALAALHRIEIPGRVTTQRERPALVPADAPEFVRRVTAEMMAGRGDDLPVSALPVDGTYPSGTTAFEKRNVSDLVAQWDPDLCIQCGNCSFVCPHSVIRSKFYNEAELAAAPDGFPSRPLDARGLPDTRYTLQVYVEDCTGCALCVEACPVSAPGEPARKAINLAPREPLVARERENIAFFETLPVNDRSRVDFGTVRGTQFLQPLFEFSGACAGCGETPYLKVLSQLFGDRLMIANATGCSSIYGGNLPTTPWTSDAAGRGPAWSNSLFEDNAEFGLGYRLAADLHLGLARSRLTQLREQIGADLVDDLLAAPQRRESEFAAQRTRVAELTRRLDAISGADQVVVRDLESVLDHLVRRSVWLVGGDGWAYDIGSGGLDHVLASGRNVNVLVLDTEVYSNTGGQSSKATPLGAVAKFAAAGKTVPKKDLALQAIAYGNVYVARVAMGADPQQTLRALREAEAYDGPSLVIAYSHCIAHGIDMTKGMDQQYRAVASGYWPLIRYDPVLRAAGDNPFLLDSPRPRIPLTDYTSRELRYRILAQTDPAEAERLLGLAEQEVRQRWANYEEMATRGPARFPADARQPAATVGAGASPRPWRGGQ